LPHCWCQQQPRVHARHTSVKTHTHTHMHMNMHFHMNTHTCMRAGCAGAAAEPWRGHHRGARPQPPQAGRAEQQRPFWRAAEGRCGRGGAQPRDTGARGCVDVHVCLCACGQGVGW
jgi:hypothetical protein